MFDLLKLLFSSGAGIFAFGGWFYFCSLVDQRYDVSLYPSEDLQVGNAILLVVLFAIGCQVTDL